MKKSSNLCPVVILIIFIYSFPTNSYSQVTIEMGPAYIVNLSNIKWENSVGLNLRMNYRISDKVSLIPKMSFNTFTVNSLRTPVHDNSFLGISLNGNETAFFTISMGLQFTSKRTTRYQFYPLFNIFSGMHFTKFGKDFNSANKKQRHIGFAGSGFGMLIPLNKKLNIIAESSFTVSFDYNYLFIPIDLLFQFKF